jgi:hypothetical protein
VSIALYGYGLIPSGGAFHPVGTVFVDGFEVVLAPGFDVALDDERIVGIFNPDAGRFLVELVPPITCELAPDIEVELQGGIDCG